MAFVQERKVFECSKKQQLPAVMLGLTKKQGSHIFRKIYSTTLNVRELYEKHSHG